MQWIFHIWFQVWVNMKNKYIYFNGIKKTFFYDCLKSDITGNLKKNFFIYSDWTSKGGNSQIIPEFFAN